LLRRASTFFRMGVAHLLLLGVVKDWWQTWSTVPKKDSEAAGWQFYLPREVQHEITSRSGNILLTELFKKAYLDVARCVPRPSVLVADGLVMC
jgi:hypothetical protein